MHLTDTLVERQPELAALRRLLEAAREGNGRLAVVEGQAGIGKTCLLRDARALGEELGFRVRTARGHELERDFPFGIVRQLFELDVVAAEEQERSSLLAGAAGQAAAALMGADPPAGERDAPDRSQSVLHGLFWLTANLSSREPLLLVVDDAHWSDAPSLRWIAYLLRRLEDIGVAMVMALQPLDAGDESALLLEALEGAEQVIALGPLSGDGVMELLERGLGAQPDVAFAGACHAATGGNPFLLRQLIGVLAQREIEPTAANAASVEALSSDEVARAVSRRLARLGPGARALAHAVAVLGANAEWHHAAELAGLASDDLHASADQLAAADLLQTGPTLEFAHPIVRSAVYAGLPAGERAAMHRRAAELLATAGAPADRAASHLLATHPANDAWAVDVLHRAARESVGRGAPDAAASYLRRALAERPAAADRAGVMLALGASEVRAGEPAGIDHLAEAMEAADDVRLRGIAALELGLAMVAHARAAEAVEVLGRAVEELRDTVPNLALRLHGELLAAARLDIGTRPVLRRWLERLPERLGDDTPAERLILAVQAIEAALVGAPPARAVELAERALGGGDVSGPQLAHSPGFNQAAYALIVADRLDLAERFYAQALQDARARGSLVAFAVVSCWRSHLAYRRGSVAEAEAEARSALAASSEAWHLGRPAALSFLLEALIERGDLEAAEQAAAGTPPREAMSGSVMLNGLLFSRGRLRLAQSRAREALDDLLECGRRQEAWGARNPAVLPWRSAAALAHAALGERDAARALSEEELELARAAESSRATGEALRVAGLVQGGRRGLKLLGEAVETLADSPARLEHARALVDLGAALRRAGQRVRAREPLRAGLDLASRCGAGALVEQARTELRAAGARPRRLVLTGVDSLTASELRVAEMASEGLSNRDIAQGLFVTLKTVELHLRNVYRKLDIESRGQLHDALGAPASLAER